AVDAPDRLTHLASHVGIFRNARPAAGRDLQIGNLAAPVREISEEALKRAHAFGNALAVVEPVDADDHGPARQAVQHLAHKAGLDRAARETRESFSLHSHRERADANDTIAEMKTVPCRPGQPAFIGNVPRKIRRIDFGLETDQVVVAERRDQLIMIWQGCDYFRGRERNVYEEPDLVVMPAIAQCL